MKIVLSFDSFKGTLAAREVPDFQALEKTIDELLSNPTSRE